MPGFKRKILALLALGAVTVPAQDARDIVRRSVRLDERNSKVALAYTFLERDVERQLDSQDNVKSTRCRAYDVTMQEGSPYRRLVARDDKPLPPAEDARELEKLRHNIEERKRETQAQRAKRLADWEKRRQRLRNFLTEVPEAYDFTLLGEDTLRGRAVWVIQAEPKSGYRARTSEGKLLGKFRGKLWIDQAASQWVKVQAETVETVSFGWLLVRVAKGTHAEAEQVRVNDEVWLPARVHAGYSVRIGLLKKIVGDIEIAYSNYRKFQADSRLVSTTETR